jgi:hypothetical protein
VPETPADECDRPATEAGGNALPARDPANSGQAQMPKRRFSPKPGLVARRGGEGDFVIIAARDQLLQRRLRISPAVEPGLGGC